MIYFQEVEELPTNTGGIRAGDIFVVVDGEIRNAYEAEYAWKEAPELKASAGAVDQYGTMPAPVEREQTAVNIDGTMYRTDVVFKFLHHNIGIEPKQDASGRWWREEYDLNYSGYVLVEVKK